MTIPGGNVAPTFRNSFQIITKDLVKWFPGHMGKGMKQMEQKLKTVDCIIEVHDARVPISGRYADYKRTLTGIKPHIFILNKVDLADLKFKDSIIETLNRDGLSNVLFTNMKNDTCPEAKKLLPLTQKLIKESNRYDRTLESSFRIMVIGVPNVGKSSLINRLRNINLRKRNAAHVGAVAGITKSVSMQIKVSENPTIYVLDTPGILTPVVEDVETGLKLALVGCMQDHLVGPEVLADYLLYWLNKHERFEYVENLGLKEPNDNITYVLTFIAAKLRNTLRIKNYDGQIILKPNTRAAADTFISKFRKGELGRYCLDEDLLK